jgi:hypothetical protein
MNADFRLALRQLRKSPGFTLAAVLTLSLAIGANAIVFSVLNALVLRPLKVPNPESLFMLERAFARGNTPSQAYPDCIDLRDRNRSFESLVTYAILGICCIFLIFAMRWFASTRGSVPGSRPRAALGRPPCVRPVS